MKNKISQSVSGIIYQGQVALPGVVDYAGPLALAHVAPNVFTLNITNAIAGRASHDSAKIELRTARTTLKEAFKSARAFARIAREALRPYLGDKLNEAFAGAGFDGSFAIPRDPTKLVQMLQRIQAHLIANPTHEVLVLNVTAARAGTLAADIVTGTAAVANKKGELDLKKTDRDAKIELVRQDMTNLLSELHITLDPLSGLWAKFGFNKPGALQIPAIPANVLAVLIGPSAVAVKWNQAERASHYRVWKRVVGVDDELIPVGSPADLDFALEGLPLGATVEIAVSAVNNGGESQKTEVVTVVTSA